MSKPNIVAASTTTTDTTFLLGRLSCSRLRSSIERAKLLLSRAHLSSILLRSITEFMSTIFLLDGEIKMIKSTTENLHRSRIFFNSSAVSGVPTFYNGNSLELLHMRQLARSSSFDGRRATSPGYRRILSCRLSRYRNT